MSDLQCLNLSPLEPGGEGVWTYLSPFGRRGLSVSLRRRRPRDRVSRRETPPEGVRRRGGSRVSHLRVKARARTRGLRLVVGGLSGSAGGAGRGAAQAAEARLPRALREWLLKAKKAGAALAHRSAVVESLQRASQKRRAHARR